MLGRGFGLYKGKLYAALDTWQVYILRCGDGSLYTGITNDLIRRVQEHQEGRGAKYTRSHLPVTLAAYSVPNKDKSAIMRLENLIKGLSKAEKEQLVEPLTPLGDKPFLPRVESLELKDTIWTRTSLRDGRVGFSLTANYKSSN